MRVIVTGASGFVGSALVARLRLARHAVVATDRVIADGMPGDLLDPALLSRLFDTPVDAVIHLATVPGGAAEADPTEGWRINVESTRALVAAAAAANACPRFVFASSIAVFGDRLPMRVDDSTTVAPSLHYGAHKAMMEEWIAFQSRRGAISGVSLRLPGIVARPIAPSGMISAFMSNLFHAFRAGAQIVLPVSPDATLWLLSRGRAVDAFLQALALDALPNGPLTLPALRVSMGDLVTAVAARAGCDPALAHYRPAPAVEAAFGRQPPLLTPRADAHGFRHDGDIAALVARVFDDLDRKDEL